VATRLHFARWFAAKFWGDSPRLLRFTHFLAMKSFPLPRLALVLGLLGSGAVSAGTALADPQFPGRAVGPWSPNSGLQRGWVQAQRALADQSYRQTQWRLDQLDRCLSSARERWANDQCLRRDEQVRERQRRRDQQEWQLLMGRQGFTAQLPGRPGLSL
jgi:hypothetical protein